MVCTPEGRAGFLKFSASDPIQPDVIDPRRAAHPDWFAQSWFPERTKLCTAVLTDPAYADPKMPIVAEWNDIFGYQDGRGG